MFPVSNKAQDVVDTLVTTIERQHVTIKEEEAVSRIEVKKKIKLSLYILKIIVMKAIR